MSKKLAFSLKILVSSIVLFVLLRQLDLSSIGQQIRQSNPIYIGLAVLTILLGQGLSALRWAWIAKGLGLTVRYVRKLRLYFLGMFLSLFLPSIIGGDVVRGILIAKDRPGSRFSGAMSVVLERVNGLIALLGVVALCALLSETIPQEFQITSLAVFVVVFSVHLIYPSLHGNVPEKFHMWKSMPLNSSEFAHQWFRGLGISFIFQTLVVAAHVFLAEAVGLELAWTDLGFIVCVVALASAVPISFNGFGIREAGYVGLTVWLGGNEVAAAAMAALWVVVLICSALPGAWVLWKMGLKGIR